MSLDYVVIATRTCRPNTRTFRENIKYFHVTCLLTCWFLMRVCKYCIQTKLILLFVDQTSCRLLKQDYKIAFLSQRTCRPTWSLSQSMHCSYWTRIFVINGRLLSGNNYIQRKFDSTLGKKACELIKVFLLNVYLTERLTVRHCQLPLRLHNHSLMES